MNISTILSISIVWGACGVVKDQVKIRIALASQFLLMELIGATLRRIAIPIGLVVDAVGGIVDVQESGVQWALANGSCIENQIVHAFGAMYLGVAAIATLNSNEAISACNGAVIQRNCVLIFRTPAHKSIQKHVRFSTTRAVATFQIASFAVYIAFQTHILVVVVLINCASAVAELSVVVGYWKMGGAEVAGYYYL